MVTGINSDQFEDTIMKLFEIASKDKIISDEEGALIMGIKLDLTTYLEAVSKAEEDGRISPSESTKLKEFRNTIVLKAGIIAAKDHQISEDEKSIIKKLVEILKT